MAEVSPGTRRRHLKALERRRDYLTVVLSTPGEQVNSFDVTERQALDWVLGEVRSLRQQVDELNEDLDWLESRQP
jgi:ubiquinone biosynthesis protein UbiJ